MALAAIEGFAAEAMALFPAVRAKFYLANAGDIGGIGAMKAPHYVQLYSEPGEGYLFNAGFLRQQMDFFLSCQGLGSCWLGMAKSKEPDRDGLEYVIMLALGKAQGSPYRRPEEFNRRPLSEIATGEDSRLEAVRFAPSAKNSQPWFFACEGGEILVYRKRPAGIMDRILNRLNQIDIGIALSHLMAAGEKQGIPFVFDAAASLPERKGFLPVGAVRG